VVLSKRAAVLRNYEDECYQICYYLLQQESLALKAASKVVYDLFLDELFFDRDQDRQRKLMQHAAIKAALSVSSIASFAPA